MAGATSIPNYTDGKLPKIVVSAQPITPTSTHRENFGRNDGHGWLEEDGDLWRLQ